jgi:phosphate transport system permease protein
VIPPPSRRERLKDSAFRLLIILCTVAGVAMLALLLYDVAADGFGKLSFDFLTSFPSAFPDKAGIESPLMGTLWLMAVCAGFIVPVGVATAIYLEEYADRNRWWNRFIEVNIQNLAAVPSILEGSLALGATQWQTIRKQVLPAAVPGIATGVILALSRAIGETAPLILVGAASFVAFNPESLDSAYTALPLQIFEWISRPQDEFKLLAAAGILVLLALLLTMNGVAIWLRNRFEQQW